MLIGQVISLIVNSQTGYLVYVGDTLVYLCSKKQTLQLQQQSKFRVIANTAAELDWIAALMFELGISVSTPYFLWFNNFEATQLSANLVYHSKIKHNDLNFHFVR